MKKLLFFISCILSSVMMSAHDFVVDGIYYTKSGTTCTVTYRGTSYSSYSNEYSGTVVIPESVTYSGTTYSVVGIGGSAFRGCTNLTSVTIPRSIASIAYYAFYGCTGMTSIDYNARSCANFPAGNVDNGAFYDAGKSSTGITVTIGKEVETIPSYLFYPVNGTGGTANLPKIIAVNFDDASSCKTIGSNAFKGCSGITSLTIPNSVTTIESYAFDGCTGITSLTIPNSVTSIGGYAFYGCTGITSLTIPNSVTTIENYTFDGCTGITSLTIPNSVTSIGGYAFYGCTGITSLTIPNSVTAIENYAFRGCDNIKVITLGKNLERLGEYSLSCSGVKEIHSLNVLPPVCETSKFTSVSGTSTVSCYVFGAMNKQQTLLYVPKGSKEFYEKVYGWKDFIGIIEEGADGTGSGNGGGNGSGSGSGTGYDDPNRCAEPSISFADKTLTLSCTTPQSKVHYSYYLSNVGTVESGQQTHTVTKSTNAVTVIAYATAEGYNQSKTVIQTFPFEASIYDINGDNKITIADVTTLIDIIVNE